MDQPKSLEDMIAAEVAALPAEAQPTAYPEPAPGAGKVQSPGPILAKTVEAVTGRPLGTPADIPGGVGQTLGDWGNSALQYGSYLNPTVGAVGDALGMKIPHKSFSDVANQNAAEVAATKARPQGTLYHEFGTDLPGAVATLAAPPRALPQALLGAGLGALTPNSGAVDTGLGVLGGGLSSGAGQALVSGAGKTVNALRGEFNPVKEVYDFAKKHNVDLSAGDVSKSSTLSKAEALAFKSPTGSQGEQIADFMTNGGKTNNILQDAVKSNYAIATQKANEAYAALDAAASAAGVRGIVPRQTYEALRALKPYRSTIDNIDNDIVRARLLDIVDSDETKIPKSMSFAELDALRKSLGPVMQKIKLQAPSPFSNITSENSGTWQQMYKKISNDLETWGGALDPNSPWYSKKLSEGAPPDIVAAFKNSKDVFKNEVLPFRDNDIASKLIDGGYDGAPEMTVRDLLKKGNATKVRELKALFKENPQHGRLVVDTLTGAQRGSHDFANSSASARGGNGWMLPSAVMGAAGASLIPLAVSNPGLAAKLALAAGLEQGGVHALNSRVGLPLLMAKPNTNRVANALGRGALGAVANQYNSDTVPAQRVAPLRSAKEVLGLP
jgi:hypothetical protein